MKPTKVRVWVELKPEMFGVLFTWDVLTMYCSLNVVWIGSMVPLSHWVIKPASGETTAYKGSPLPAPMQLHRF